MLTEEVEVEGSFVGEWVVDIRIEVDSNESAAVVGAQRYLTAWVGADGAISEVGIAVGYTLTKYSIPEQHSRFCRLPSVMYYLLPQRRCIDIFDIHWVGRVDRELLSIHLMFCCSAHELIVDFYRHIGSGHLSLHHLGVDKTFGVGVFDSDR